MRRPGAHSPCLLKKQIVINAGKDRSRIAIVENGELVELYIETPDNVRSIGNIYLGRVQKVMPAIRAAFVDVGQKQDCFLHFSDLTDNFPQLLALAGEDVPGLDEPVLSMAPAKRVADDENEPDVEDALEVESAPEATEEEAPKRRRSRRRSRGRGRGRGRDKGREEEEEQEERGESDGDSRRPLPSVLDLTSAPKRRPTRTPKLDPKAEEPSDQASEPTDEAPKAEARDTKPSKPKRSRRSSAPSDDATEAASGDGSGEPDAKADDQNGSDTKPRAEKDGDGSEEKPKRKRRRRGRRGRGRNKSESGAQGADDSGVDDSGSDDSGEPSRSRRKSRKSEGSGPKGDSDSGNDTSPDSAEKQSRGGRVRLSERRIIPASANEPEAEPDSEPDTDSDSTESGSGRRRLPSTLDLTGSSKPKSSGRRSSRDDSDDDSSDDSKDGGRSRRRSRDDSGSSKGSDGRGRRSETDDADSSETSDADSKDSGRSRRRSSKNDGGSSDDSSSRRGRSKDAEPKGDDSDDGSKGGGRSRRGRSDDSDSKSGRNRGGGRSGTSGRGSSGGSSKKSGRIPPSEELLRRNGSVIVKITKEAISTKGPRVSSDLSLAGRFLVLVPAADYVAVSKKIESAKERRRLRTLATSLKPDGFGVIVRTVAEGRDAKSLDTDLRLLADRWRKIERKLNENPEPPVLLYQDVNMVSSIIRDLFSDDFDRILVDDEKTFRNVRAYIKAVAPDMADKVEMHKGRQPVFRSLGIETQVEEAFSKRVNMKGGGYLYIETTEAMHVVDVNSGRAGRGKSQKQNLIDVNVAAAKEVAKQLRLRDLGGIIVVDFIDLRYDRDRKKVTDALKEAFKRDRAVTKLLPMSDFGLVQITRQRLRPSITTQTTDEDGNPLDAADAKVAAGAAEIPRTSVPEPAPEADAPDERSGRDDRPDRPALAPEDATPRALSGRLRGWLDHYRRTVDERYKGRPIVVRVHPLLAAYLRRGFPSPLTRWRLALRGITFTMEEDATVDPLAFDVRDQKSGRSLLKKYSS